jgi:hypothetical protein
LNATGPTSDDVLALARRQYSKAREKHRVSPHQVSNNKGTMRS